MRKQMNRRSFLSKASKLSAAAAGIFFAPAVIAKKSIHWKMVTTWPKNFPGVGTGANELAKSIEELSDGQIKVKVYGAGELVPAMGVFDAVSRGTAQMGHGAAYYWKGKHAATQFFGAVPFGMMAHESNAWLAYGNGQKLWDEIYAPFGLKAFAAGNTGVQMGGWFNKKIDSPKNFKGLKMRMPGLGGEVVSRLGATVVSLPGGELFQALKSGAIDASEWIGPYNDLAFGFHKAAKYYYWPGWHEPGATLECMINKKAYDELPRSLKKVVEVACEAANLRVHSEYNARNASALKTLTETHKVKTLQFPKTVLAELGKQSQAVLSEVAKTDAMSKKIYEDYSKFQKLMRNWEATSEAPYVEARKAIFG